VARVFVPLKKEQDEGFSTAEAAAGVRHPASLLDRVETALTFSSSSSGLADTRRRPSLHPVCENSSMYMAVFFFPRLASSIETNQEWPYCIGAGVFTLNSMIIPKFVMFFEQKGNFSVPLCIRKTCRSSR
jgi:hypothetical protein